MISDAELFSNTCPRPWYGPDEWMDGDDPVACSNQRDEEILRWLAERQRRVASMGAVRRFWHNHIASSNIMPPENPNALS